MTTPLTLELTVVDGPDRGRKFVFRSPATIAIGRSSSCEVPVNDPKISRKHCRIEKGGFRAMAVMTDEGLSIPYLPSRPACGSYPGRMRVDGQKIGKLPLKTKLAAMSRGITFARPYQTPWPKCQPMTEFTGLYRFTAALARLKAEWRKFR